MVLGLAQRENKKEALPRAQFDSGDDVNHQEMRKCMQGDLKRLWSMWVFSQCGISQMCEPSIAFEIIQA